MERFFHSKILKINLWENKVNAPENVLIPLVLHAIRKY